MKLPTAFWNLVFQASLHLFPAIVSEFGGVDNMDTELMNLKNRRVVVIGGGVAGSLLAKSLQFHADVTLLDPWVSFSFSPLFSLHSFPSKQTWVSPAQSIYVGHPIGKGKNWWPQEKIV